MPRWINAPNLLTASRLALAPVVVAAILGGRHFAAIAVFALAALTDLLDGWAARRFGSSTQAGAYLDPIADKCLLSGVFLALAMARVVPWWFVAIVFGRDVYLLTAAAMLAAAGRRKFTPSVWGKASTFVQIATAIAWLAGGALESPVTLAISRAMLWPCAALTIWSGLHYTWRAMRAPRAD
jgi:cardiolipin synthase